MYRLPSFCPARTQPTGEIQCNRLQNPNYDCRKCMAENTDNEVKPQ